MSGPERTQCRVPDLPLHAGIRHVLDTLGAAEPWPDSALRALRAACDGHPAPLHHTAAAVLRAAARLAHARQAARTAGGDPTAHPAAVDAAGRLDAAVAAYERAVAGALPATPTPPPPAGPAGGPRTR